MLVMCDTLKKELSDFGILINSTNIPILLMCSKSTPHSLVRQMDILCFVSGNIHHTNTKTQTKTLLYQPLQIFLICTSSKANHSTAAKE